MKRLLAVAIFVLTAIPCHAVDRTMDEIMGVPGEVQKNPGTAARRPGSMMRTPQHFLMMAYHKNVMAFGTALQKAAGQGETVPGDFARIAVSEMRRSTEEMEKHRAVALASAPDASRGEMQKKMEEHVIRVKTHLRQLEDLTARDRIPSQEVLNHLQAIFAGCDGMGEPLRHEGRPGRGLQHEPGSHDPECAQCDSHKMMPEHRKMMMEMTQKLKAQDAELIQRVDKMKRASRGRKVDQLAEIVSVLVQQRAAVTSQMEKMQRQSINQGRPAASGAPAWSPLLEDDEEVDYQDPDDETETMDE